MDGYRLAAADAARGELRPAFFFGLHLTTTLLVVRLPAFGFVETTKPLPRMRYLQRAFFSFFFAFRTLMPFTFGTLQRGFFVAGGVVMGTRGVTGGGGGRGGGITVSIRPTLSPRNSVNQSAPSGPVVTSDGSLPRVGTPKWLVTVPPVVMRPIEFAVDSVNQIAPSRPPAIADGPAPAPGYSVTTPPYVIWPIWLAANSVNHKPAPGTSVIPDGSLPGVGTVK
jgi:hypothetical protein